MDTKISKKEQYSDILWSFGIMERKVSSHRCLWSLKPYIQIELYIFVTRPKSHIVKVLYVGLTLLPVFDPSCNILLLFQSLFEHDTDLSISFVYP